MVVTCSQSTRPRSAIAPRAILELEIPAQRTRSAHSWVTSHRTSTRESVRGFQWSVWLKNTTRRGMDSPYWAEGSAPRLVRTI
jgi:hypothetical protein